ncbi:MAG: hypothetical protein J6B26_01460 [Agathobacter sp.]|nr:hypothetical protein [Agathobacter sp.]MBP3568120.1 hypothetical protein [Lachnospiraceae bacterium]
MNKTFEVETVQRSELRRRMNSYMTLGKDLTERKKENDQNKEGKEEE